MRACKDFIITTLMGGLLVVLPLLVFYLLTPELVAGLLLLITSFAVGLAGARGENEFLPALLLDADGSRQLVYVVERGEAGLATVLMPHAPTGFSGPVKIVPAAQLQALDASIGDASKVLSLWGVGMQGLCPRPHP